MIMKSDETKKVLVFVNDPQTRQWLSGWFQDNGFDPQEIKDVESVKTQLSPDSWLVVSDINGPSPVAERLIQNIRSVDSDLPIVLVAPADSKDRAVQCLKIGATDYLVKPLSATELSAKIDRALDERKLRQELAALRSAKSSTGIVANLASGQKEVKTLQRIEKETILEALDGFGGARGKTAKALGISVRTLQRKIKEYGYTNGGDKSDNSNSFSSVNQSNALNN